MGNEILGSFHDGRVGPCFTTPHIVLGNLESLTLFITTVVTASSPAVP